MSELPEKKKGTSTCVVCGIVIKDHLDHLQTFQRHLKSKQHSKHEGWHCKVDNCRRRNFKKGGNRTCTKEKTYFRFEDQVEHETEKEYAKRNEKEINAAKINSLTCKVCLKMFSHRFDKSKHEKFEKCKYKRGRYLKFSKIFDFCGII